MTEAKWTVSVGILFSTTGPYGTIGRELRDGALLGIEVANRIAEQKGHELRLAPLVIDLGGSLDAYRVSVETLLAGGTRHIIGCYTSSSRKEIIPSIEKFDGLLWYPSHYEGFESSPNVIYGGAAPNQHVVPLANWVMPRYGAKVYCLGSNYIWAWENSRIMRLLAEGQHGRVMRERFLPVGDLDMESAIEEIAELAPDFIFNTLIGDSSYAFYRAYHALGQRDERFAAATRPIASCTLSEPELKAIGNEAAVGHIASSVYFNSVDRPENADFVHIFKERFGAARVTSADAEATYLLAHLLAESLRVAGTEHLEPVKQALYGCRLAAPQGAVRIDPDNNHAWLTPRIGIAAEDAQFRTAWEAGEPTRPDPYLTQLPRPASGGGVRTPLIYLCAS